MNTLYLIRHSLTPANEQRLYCGWTDISLSEAGRLHAIAVGKECPLPACDLYATSGMKRAEETLFLLTGMSSCEHLPDLMEMNFGAFEMHGYEQLKENPEYIRWIEDTEGNVACPGGESRNIFRKRVTGCVDALIKRHTDSMLVVCHGGVIANIMQHWFPGENKNFYQWQPGACGGYAVYIENSIPVRFIAL